MVKAWAIFPIFGAAFSISAGTIAGRLARRLLGALVLAAWLAGPGSVGADTAATPQFMQQQLALHLLQQQALAFYERADYPQALTLYRQLWGQAEHMLRYPRPAPDSWQALYNRNLDDVTIAGLDGAAACLSALGEFEEALALYQQELSWVEAFGEAGRLAVVHNRLGFVYQQLAQFEKALREFHTALTEAGKEVRSIETALARPGSDVMAAIRFLNSLTTIRGTMMNVAAALYQLGRYEEVIALYDRDDWQRCNRLLQQVVVSLPAESDAMMVSALRQANLTSAICVLNDRGAAYNALAAETGTLATYRKAGEFLQEAVELARQLPEHHHLLLITTLSALGAAWEGLKDYPAALATHEEALRLTHTLPTHETRFQVQPVINLAHVYLTQQDAVAARRVLASMASVEAEQDLELLWHVHTLHGRLLELEGDLEGAAARFRQAITITETLRSAVLTPELKETFFRKYQTPYEHLVWVLQQLGQADEAFAVMEKMRARSLADKLHNVRITKGIPPALRQQEEAQAARQVRDYVMRNRARARAAARVPASRAVSEVTREPESATRTFQDILQDVPEYASLQGRDPVRPETLATYLDDTTLIVSYFLGERTAVVATLGRGGRTTVTPLPPQTPRQFEEATRLLLEQLRHPERDDWRSASTRLYQMLIRPIEQELQGYKRLLVIPSGLLHYLPFGVLAAPGSGALLVETHQIVVLPSATVLQFSRDKHHKERQTAVVFALGQVASSGFSALPGTLREAQAIRQTIPGAQLILEQQFTRRQVEQLSANRDIVHFATHGFLDSRRPLQSGLVTAEGTFSIADVFNLHLHANLVILSACQTGLGQLLRGDEVIGLTRAFMYAGTPSVLSTLWSVADASTARFMALFYQALQEPGSDKGSAMQQAQLTLLREFPHPYYWAPFQLLGDWQ
jgi:CHAT domain-containing protein